MKIWCLCIAIFIRCELSGQHLLADWEWQTGASGKGKGQHPWSVYAGMQNSYGTGKLVSMLAGVRRMGQRGSVLTLDGHWLPIHGLNTVSLAGRYQRPIGSRITLGIGLEGEQRRFDESDNVPWSACLSTWLSSEWGPWAYALHNNIRIIARPYHGPDISISWNGELLVRFVPADSKFEVGIHFSSPTTFTPSAFSAEVSHRPSVNWQYSIAFSLPSPYFGFRTYWRLGDIWSIDLRSRRHPQLGFSHNCRFIYMPYEKDTGLSANGRRDP